MPSKPLSAYPARGDREVIPRGLPGPVVTPNTGVATNHSSTVKSVDPSQGVQWNDDELSSPSQGPYDPAGQDPNLSGPTPTEQLHSWQAGELSKWDENDDYRDFTYDCYNVPESRILSGSVEPTGYTAKDGDYDDNGGIDSPLSGASGHSPAFGSDRSDPQGSWSGGQATQGGITILPVVRR